MDRNSFGSTTNTILAYVSPQRKYKRVPRMAHSNCVNVMTAAVNAPMAPMTTAVNFPFSFDGEDSRGGLARHALIASVRDSLSIIVAFMTPTSTEMVSNLSKIRTVVVSSIGMMLPVLWRLPKAHSVDVYVVPRSA